MKTTKQILIDAKQLLIDKGWTQGSFAKDTNGMPVHHYRDTAVCFCLAGAVRRANDGVSGNFTEVADILADLIPDVYEGEVACFNDDESTTKDDVLAVLDKAIEVAQSDYYKAIEVAQ